MSRTKGTREALKSTSKKVVLYGGSFNPITTGHIAVAQHVLDTLDIDKIIFVPCNQHIWGKELAKFWDRFDMILLALKKNMTVSYIEKKYKIHGTYELIQKFKERHSKDFTELFVLIGMDEANAFMKWKNFKKLSKTVNIIVCPRPGVKMSAFTKKFFKEPHIILPVCKKMEDVSSSRVRESIPGFNTHNKWACAYLQYSIDPDVFIYILKNKLYQSKEV